MQSWTAPQVYAVMLPKLNEKQRREYLASEALKLGYGGISRVARESGVSRVTITAGVKALRSGNTLIGRVRIKGGGKKPIEHHQPGITDFLELEANPKTDKRTVVKWTSHSFAHLAQALKQRGFHIGKTSVGNLLHDLGYALKANKKDLEGGSHPDRDAQFQHINMQGLKMQIQGFPILSIDAKKTEKIDNLKNNGREWMPRGKETRVNVYDYGKKKKGRVVKAIPYGVYDILRKQGFVNIGIDTNTAEFAVTSIKRWWETIGRKEYSAATEILFFADCGSSNGNTNKLWKYSLQQFASTSGLTVHVCHYPPGTSKWNAIEHEMFSFITINWRAKPLIAYEVMLECIRNTTTKTGLKITAMLDENTYEKGRKISDEQMQQINIQGDEFHPEWNYTIKPVVTLPVRQMTAS